MSEKHIFHWGDSLVKFILQERITKERKYGSVS
jgi:hypothetical protein